MENKMENKMFETNTNLFLNTEQSVQSILKCKSNEQSPKLIPEYSPKIV